MGDDIYIYERGLIDYGNWLTPLWRLRSPTTDRLHAVDSGIPALRLSPILKASEPGKATLIPRPKA